MIAVVVTAASLSSLHPKLLSLMGARIPGIKFYLNLSVDYPDRYQGALQTQDEPILMFLDQDCVVEESVFSEIKNFFESHPSIQVIFGSYQSAQAEALLARAYNKLCNAWLHSGHGGNMLGGAFAIRRSVIHCLKLRSKNWGGEDSEIGRNFQSKKVQVHFFEMFKVTHFASRSLLRFIVRAWRHGEVRSRTVNFGVADFKFFFTCLGRVRPSLLELIVISLHLTIVGLSSFLKMPQTSPDK